MTTIMIADDHDIVKRGLQAVLGAQPDFQIIGEASDGLEAAENAKKLRPDILVVDMVIPNLNGVAVTRRAIQDSPNTRVVILSMYDNEAYVLEALKAGAMAYVLKRSVSEELVMAIREVLLGHHYLSQPLSSRAIKSYIDKSQAPALNSYEMLTAREKEVLQLTAEGRTRIEIAELLGISHRTIENHRSSIMHKLGLHTQADIIKYALKHGVVSIDC